METLSQNLNKVVAAKDAAQNHISNPRDQS